MTPQQARAAWVAALRSGEYQQCKGRLTDGAGYCCLGVACELYRAEFPEKLSRGDDFYFNRNDSGGGWEQLPPLDVCAWLGMKSTDGGFFTGTHRQQLTWLNDNGHTFNQIADIIESNPPGLFIESGE